METINTPAFNFKPISDEGTHEANIGKFSIIIDYYGLDMPAIAECSVFIIWDNIDNYSKLIQHNNCVNHAINYVNKIISLHN